MKKFLIFIYLLLTTLILYANEADIGVNGSVEKIDGSFITVVVNNKKEVFKLAPKWYLMENGYSVKEGENVQLKYRKVNNVNSVTEVVKNRKVYRFTDKNGEFLWKRSGIAGKENETTSKTWQVTSPSNGSFNQGGVAATGIAGGNVSQTNSTVTTVISGGQTGITGTNGGTVIGGQTGVITGEHHNEPQFIKPTDGFHTGGKINEFGGREKGDMGGKGKREMDEFSGRER